MPRKKKKQRSTKRGRPRLNYEFEEAVEIVRKENLKSMGQYAKWWDLHTPSRLPKRPDRAYEKSWKGWGYFLGNYNEYPFVKKAFRSYDDSKKFAHSLNFKKIEEWFDYCRSGKKPEDIPSRPDVVYQRKKEWHTWSEFLGNHIDIFINEQKASRKYFYIARYPDSPGNVLCFGISTSRENLKKDNEFKVIKLYDYYEGFDWKSVISVYGKRYEFGRPNEFLISDMGALLSELSLDLFEVPIN